MYISSFSCSAKLERIQLSFSAIIIDCVNLNSITHIKVKTTETKISIRVNAINDVFTLDTEKLVEALILKENIVITHLKMILS